MTSAKYAAYNAVYAAVKNERRKAKGLCTQCGKPAAMGHTQCQKCLDKLKKRRDLLKSIGLCTRCGDHAAPGHTLCDHCLEAKRRAARGAA